MVIKNNRTVSNMFSEALSNKNNNFAVSLKLHKQLKIYNKSDVTS